MSEQSSGVDESGFGEGGESSIDADIESSGSDQGADVADEGPVGDESGSADGEESSSAAADVAAGFDDKSKAPVADDPEEDGTWRG